MTCHLAEIFHEAKLVFLFGNKYFLHFIKIKNRLEPLNIVHHLPNFLRSTPPSYNGPHLCSTYSSELTRPEVKASCVISKFLYATLEEYEKM